jgi:large repetitive protein
MRRIGPHHSSDNGKADSVDTAAADGHGHARRAFLLLGSLTLILIAGASLAAAGAFAPPKPPPPPDPPAPTITARPADPTNQTSAHFAYADAQSGVSFQCQLDGSSFGACPANGTSYAGPLAQGSHTFKVRALAGSKTSSTSSFAWTVDTVAPTTSISYPDDGLTLGSDGWGAQCPAHASICGAAKDGHGVKTVLISIQRSGGSWWGGSAFDQQNETFSTVALTSSDRDSTHWSYGLHLPADGLYMVHVRAVDDAGNTTAAAGQASARFTVDTTPPPAPAITAEPAANTISRTATFAFADSEHGARLLCRRDGARFSACSSPQSYSSLALGAHRFEVEAVDAVGNSSSATGYSWTVAKTVEQSGKPFTVTGNASGPLAPGVTRTLAVSLANPNNVAIEVTALSVSAASGSSKAGCDGPANLQLIQSNISSAHVLAIPANGHVALPAGAVSAPEVLMRDLPTNQDACKNASFTFTYSGSAHS